MDNLSQVDKNTAYQILSRVAGHNIEINLKGKDNQTIYKTTLAKNSARRHYYIENRSLVFDVNAEITFKIIVDKKLYFLKTNIKKAASQFYFEHYEHLFELVRRKKPRFSIPEHWAQSAKIQGIHGPADLKSPAVIIDMSKAGMRLEVKSELPRYEINQPINLYFKLYRRAEILVKSKIIYLKNNKDTGPTIGVQFEDNSILISNKIQNVCDDLAFYYAAESDVK